MCHRREFAFVGAAALTCSPLGAWFSRQSEDSGVQAGLKQQLSRFTKRLTATPVEIKRNSPDGVMCMPGEVTLANVVEKAALHKKLELDPARIALKDEVAWPLKRIGSFSATYTLELGDEDHQVSIPSLVPGPASALAYAPAHAPSSPRSVRQVDFTISVVKR